MKKFVVIASVFGLISYSLFARGIETEAKKALKEKGKVIICSPTGRDGSLKPNQALGALKKGYILKLLPGNYESELKINLNGIIIEGVPSKKSNVDIELTGKDCIIRNIWLDDIELKNAAVIVNTIFNYCRFYSSNSNNKRTLKYYLYNSVGSHIYAYSSYYHDSEINIMNCSLIYNSTSSACLDGRYNVIFNIANSVLYGKCKVFHFYEYDSPSSSHYKEPSAKLTNNIMYGGTMLGDKEVSGKRPKTTSAFKLNDLRDICRLRGNNKNKVQEIGFLHPSRSYDLNPYSYQLKNPIDGIGAKLGKEWYPEGSPDVKEDEDNNNNEQQNTVSSSNVASSKLSNEYIVSLSPKDDFFFKYRDGFFPTKEVALLSKGSNYNKIQSKEKYYNFELEFEVMIKSDTDKFRLELLLRQDDDAGVKIYFYGKRMYYYVRTNGYSVTSSIDLYGAIIPNTWQNIYVKCNNEIGEIYLNGQSCGKLDLHKLKNPGRFKLNGHFYSSNGTPTTARQTMTIRNMKLKNK